MTGGRIETPSASSSNNEKKKREKETTETVGSSGQPDFHGCHLLLMTTVRDFCVFDEPVLFLLSLGCVVLERMITLVNYFDHFQFLSAIVNQYGHGDEYKKNNGTALKPGKKKTNSKMHENMKFKTAMKLIVGK